MNNKSPKKRKLRITVGRYSGFCFGVKRAYDLACVNSGDCDDLYILGKLVHNNDVCRNLEKRGIKEIKSLNQIKDGTIIFTAHGIDPSLYKKASARGIKIIDTTCPKVIKVQRLAKNYAEKGWQVLLFGDKRHKEVKSIKEWANGKAKIIRSLAEVKKIKFAKLEKFCLLSQTTQNIEEFKKIKDYLSRKVRHFAYFNTICESTDARQKEIRKLAKKNDIVIIIGGRDSANSRRLYEIAKSINPKSYFIEKAGQLKKSWFKDMGKVAIGAGASTPEWIIDEVITRTKKIR